MALIPDNPTITPAPDDWVIYHRTVNLPQAAAVPQRSLIRISLIETFTPDNYIVVIPTQGDTIVGKFSDLYQVIDNPLNDGSGFEIREHGTTVTLSSDGTNNRWIKLGDEPLHDQAYIMNAASHLFTPGAGTAVPIVFDNAGLPVPEWAFTNDGTKLTANYELTFMAHVSAVVDNVITANNSEVQWLLDLVSYLIEGGLIVDLAGGTSAPRTANIPQTVSAIGFGHYSAGGEIEFLAREIHQADTSHANLLQFLFLITDITVVHR